MKPWFVWLNGGVIVTCWLTATETLVLSMATELLIHAYLDGVFAAWVRAGETRGRQDGKFYRTARRLKNATAVIDMGERSVDTNRWVFDLLSHGYGALCLLLGRSA